MTDWVTADTHLDHKNIIEYNNRPFKDVFEMNDFIVQTINKYVKENDNLYIIGDFIMSRDIKRWEYFTEKIKCKNIHLISGNHDQKFASIRYLFKNIKDRMFVKTCKEEFVMEHYAMRVWPKSHYGAYHLYGHSHGMLYEEIFNLSFDVGFDVWMRPLKLTEVIEIMKKKKSLIAKLSKNLWLEHMEGTVEYSEERDMFFGKIISHEDLTYEGKSMLLLKKDFNKIVCNYKKIPFNR